MSISVNEIYPEEYSQRILSTSRSLPLWLSPKFIECYKDKLILMATSGGAMKGFWVVPLTTQDNVKIAKRQYRFLPYSSPLILEEDNLKRREIMFQLFRSLTKICDSIYLPMDPNFKDLPAIQSWGALVEWRHTHLLTRSLEFDKIDGRLRNHIKYAQNNVEIITNINPVDFRFDIAIKGSGDEKNQRQQLALNLLANGQAIIITAKNKNRICAGIFLAFDHQTAYMMHSWQLEDTPRGTISKLIFEAVRWTFDVKKLKVFDFEGSVINNIDYFFCGFNANITPYGFIHWSNTKGSLNKLIDRSLDVDGRLNPEYINKN